MAGDYRAIGQKMRTQAASASFSGVQPSKMLYLGLGCIALLKDLLDLVGLGSLPGIGTIVTICFSFFIWMLMTLFDRSGGKSNKKMARGQVLVGFSLVEAFGFGLNFLPIETLTVVALYIMAQRAAKKEEKRLREEEKVNNAANQAKVYRMQARAAQEAEVANDEQYEHNQVRKVA